MTLYCRGRAFESHHLKYLSAAIQTLGDVFTHLATHLVIVGTHKCRELLAVGLPFKNDDGNTAVVGAVYGGGDGSDLIGGNDKQVDATGHETVNLLYLPLVAVIGSSKAQLNIVMEIISHAQFCILLLAPDVIRTL